MKRIIDNLYVSCYPDVADMSEKERSKYAKIGLLWPWEVIEGEDIEAAYQRYQKAPWKGKYSDYDIVFSDPEGKDPDYLDMKELNHAADQIQTSLSLGKKVLIFCKMGLERTPTAAIFFLHKYREMSISGAELFVRQKHPATMPTISHWLMKIEKAEEKDLDL